MRKCRRDWLLLLAAALFAVPAGCDGERQALQPDILLLMADQFRGDALGCAGNPAAVTPNLDRLAAEGCRFERAYSSTPSCTPARAALLTGMSPWGHGMLGYSKVAPRYPHELPRILAAAGYSTCAIGKNHFSPPRSSHGYQRIELGDPPGPDRKDLVSDYRKWFAATAPELDPLATGLGLNDYRARPYALDESLHPTTWTGDRAVAFLEEQSSATPLLLKVSFVRPHSPYDPPARWLERIDASLVPPPFAGRWSEAAYGDFSNPRDHRATHNHLPLSVVRTSRRAYYASIAFVDEQIGRILEAQRRRGRLERTLILFLSDHGDMLGDHYLWRKAQPYEGAARIPFLLAWGDEILDAQRGQVRKELVELRDVLPTVLDAAGIPAPEEVEGRSLLDLVRGKTEGWRGTLDLEHASMHWPGNAWNALTDGRFKYVYFAKGGREQLFDLEEDPGESRNLADEPDRAPEVELWRQRMVAHLSPRGQPWVVQGRLGRRARKILLGPNYPGKPR